jgi:MYXO-CTERM domain-containing protein
MNSTFGKLVLAAAVAASLPLAAQAGTQSFDVLARDNSVAFATNDAAPLNTGIVLSVGDTLDITAVGLWNGGACGFVDANGSNCFGNEGVTGINYYSLIGKIGSNDDLDNTWFKVGTSYSGTAATAGTLYLAYLDSDSFNNSGFVTATVTVVPEAGTWAMMLAGLAGVAAVSRRRQAARA